MTQPSDGIDEAFEGILRVGLTSAARTATMLAEQRARQLRETAMRDQQAAREMQDRIDQQRRLETAGLASVHRDTWWDQARPDEIARAYETARTWSDIDPRAVEAEERIVEQLRTRYDIDMRSQVADPDRLRDRLEHAREQGQQPQPTAQEEQARADALMAEAARIEQDFATLTEQAQDQHNPALAGEAVEARDEHDTTQQQAEVAWDSAERRRDTEARLSQHFPPETVEAHMLADTAQAQPATAINGHEHSPKVRNRRWQLGKGRTQQRNGLGR